ncbi:hypothetical protein ACNKHT_21015 [Shigella flexneri]
MLPGAVSRIGGASFEDFQQDLLNLSKRAWLARKPISQGGLLKIRPRRRIPRLQPGRGAHAATGGTKRRVQRLSGIREAG